MADSIIVDIPAKHMETIRDVLGNQKKGEVIKLLLDEEGLHFNEICRRVGGSKTTVSRVLTELTDLAGVLENEMGRVKDKQYRHVVKYRISEEYQDIFGKLRNLL